MNSVPNVYQLMGPKNDELAVIYKDLGRLVALHSQQESLDGVVQVNTVSVQLLIVETNYLTVVGVQADVLWGSVHDRQQPAVNHLAFHAVIHLDQRLLQQVVEGFTQLFGQTGFEFLVLLLEDLL